MHLCKTTYNHYTHKYAHADNQTYIQKRRGKRISEKKRKGTDTLLNMFFDSDVGCKCMCVFVNIKHMCVCVFMCCVIMFRCVCSYVCAIICFCQCMCLGVRVIVCD